MPESEDLDDESLCDFCDRPIPARRLKMRGAKRYYCRDQCFLDAAEVALGDDEPEPDDLDGDQGDEPEGPTLQEVMDDPAYTPGQKIAFATAWGAKKVWDAFKKEKAAPPPEALAPLPAEGELQVLLMKLKLPVNATKEMISDRRRQLAKKYHPDVAGPKGAKAMAAVNVDADRALALCDMLGRA